MSEGCFFANHTSNPALNFQPLREKKIQLFQLQTTPNSELSPLFLDPQDHVLLSKSCTCVPPKFIDLMLITKVMVLGGMAF
jgi:hypothetical protein